VTGCIALRAGAQGAQPPAGRCAVAAGEHRLAAQTQRFLQQHPAERHWAVVVITPHHRLKLGPRQALQVFLEQQVVWLSLEELSRRPRLDPLLTLPVRPEGELAASSRQILSCRPDLGTGGAAYADSRFPQLNEEERAARQRTTVHAGDVQYLLNEGRDGRELVAVSLPCSGKASADVTALRRPAASDEQWFWRWRWRRPESGHSSGCPRQLAWDADTGRSPQRSCRPGRCEACPAGVGFAPTAGQDNQDVLHD